MSIIKPQPLLGSLSFPLVFQLISGSFYSAKGMRTSDYSFYLAFVETHYLVQFLTHEIAAVLTPVLRDSISYVKAPVRQESCSCGCHSETGNPVGSSRTVRGDAGPSHAKPEVLLLPLFFLKSM